MLLILRRRLTLKFHVFVSSHITLFIVSFLSYETNIIRGVNAVKHKKRFYSFFMFVCGKICTQGEAGTEKLALIKHLGFGKVAGGERRYFLGDIGFSSEMGLSSLVMANRCYLKWRPAGTLRRNGILRLLYRGSVKE